MAAVAAGDGEVGHAVFAAAGEVGDELGVFIIGVGGDHEDAGEGAEAFHVLRMAVGSGASAAWAHSAVRGMQAAARRVARQVRQERVDRGEFSRGGPRE